MSHTTSPSVQRPYGVVRVCQEWGLSRATFYHQQGRGAQPSIPAKRGPKTAYTDEALTGHIRTVITISLFLGEGHRKVWARLRAQGIRTSCVFRPKPTTDSDASRPPVPAERGH
ncbi:MAG: hypothetical protein P0121_15650 [Nitrospira sp.]|nr:hypothetical protein [Nitrospira sp.]